MKKNKNGLSRHIPAKIALEIRKRSKFGCVICRAGIFEYEHIEVTFANAKEHNPNNICCLCSSCHSKVTRKIYSKEYVRKKYDEVRSASSDNVIRPFDDLDFHTGTASIVFGGLTYSDKLKSIVRYHGVDIISISPDNELGIAGVNAIFLDDSGNEIFRIVGRVWYGANDAWDIEVKGNSISVRKKRGDFSVKLRLEPPGKIVIERLDMRISDAHILATEHHYAVARCADGYDPYWFSAVLGEIDTPNAGASAIEFLTPLEVELRDRMWNGRGQRLATSDEKTVMQTGLGVTYKPMGVIAASKCQKFRFYKWAFGGPRNLSKMKRAVFHNPEKLYAYIGRGDW